LPKSKVTKRRGDSRTGREKKKIKPSRKGWEGKMLQGENDATVQNIPKTTKRWIDEKSKTGRPILSWRPTTTLRVT